MLDQKILERLEQYPTPFYFYDLRLLEKTLSKAKSAAQKNQIHIHYALKANYNQPILERIVAAGFGADCVSGAEVLKALESGFKPEGIMLAGVGKTDREIEIAIDHNIACINVESAEELSIIAKIAKSKKKVATIALRINPHVEAFTHQFITTGTIDDKFGIGTDELPELFDYIQKQASLKFCGLHFHIGSQISDASVLDTLCEKVNEINQWFLDRNCVLPVINMGGGLAIDYENPDQHPIPDFESYFHRLHKNLKIRPEQKILVELGRSIVGQCGSLVTKVTFKKKSGTKEFLILDAGMTELIRPALYGAKHKIQKLNATPHDLQNTIKYEVVGPICESSDSFGSDVLLPVTSRRNILIIRSTGAYGEVMSSNYNLREKAPAVYIE